ncbi:hypothetical protein BO94DRAFT_534676 [Aspergillus sclerotioniger CBS 115572]|uniref:Secreted protein n=1 Tax=Aspergillus sclerotioniger CBS 115572 TaxID=1450535 RepID=A0A317WU15_9EURO|nr:hypothetical protein BO94DRAFT_534676 [Aspergillus sclerotioniger CBS 115572]PWY88772.1 hypothetical protein BO94DRAFT_534676 [Aspergillus sclerotioniger CBS 115572]
MVRYLLPGTSVPWLVPKSILLLTLRWLRFIHVINADENRSCSPVLLRSDDGTFVPDQVSKIRFRLVLTRSDAKGAMYTSLLIHWRSQC